MRCIFIEVACSDETTLGNGRLCSLLVPRLHPRVSFARAQPPILAQGLGAGNEIMKRGHTHEKREKLQEATIDIKSESLSALIISIYNFKSTTAEAVMAEADFTSILSSKPKLKTLNKYHDLHKEWYILGAELEIDNEDLNKVEDKYSDDRMRMLKMFGGWLEKGENPTYRTLLKALVDIDKKDIAQSICTDLGK